MNEPRGSQGLGGDTKESDVWRRDMRATDLEEARESQDSGGDTGES